MRRFLLPVLAAAVLTLSTASTALMATQSRVICDNGIPSALATVTISWDDVALLLTRVVVNNVLGVYPFPVSATVLVNGRNFSATVQPGSTLDQAIPTNAAGRLQLFINPDNGRLDGVDWSCG